MKGGYQILDLTGATAGSPVEVKGIYKAAAGNNGKPVLILTNDGQRVYAEIAEDDGDYVTCYISAEGKTVNITIEPDDSVTTVVSDPGASIPGLEQAVNELNENKAAKSDITGLECTGTKNTTGSTIPAGKYFYLNGALCKATADIENNATFTLNTNFTVVTIDEELSALNSKLITIIGEPTDKHPKLTLYRVSRIGNSVSLYFVLSHFEYTGRIDTICNLPVNFRPKVAMIEYVAVSNPATGQFMDWCYTGANTDGTIAVAISTQAGNGGMVYFSFNYEV